MRVVFSDEAEADLEEIGDYIAGDNPVRAISFVVELRRCCAELARMPRAFPLLPRRPASGIRRRVHGNYLIFYVIGDRRIEIARVLHGAQDYEAVLFPEA